MRKLRSEVAEDVSHSWEESIDVFCQRYPELSTVSLENSSYMQLRVL